MTSPNPWWNDHLPEVKSEDLEQLFARVYAAWQDTKAKVGPLQAEATRLDLAVKHWMGQYDAASRRVDVLELQKEELLRELRNHHTVSPEGRKRLNAVLRM